jgi:hypothetical protein
MSKRLIIILALAFVVGLSLAAYAEVQNVKVSGDLTVYGLSRKLWTSPTVDNTEKAMASVTRVRIDADLTDNVMATVRLLNERYWGREIDNAGGANTKNSDIDLDLAYVTMKEFMYSPLTLTVGRQELHFGNDMIVGDRDTNNNVSNASPFNGIAGAWPRDPDLSARKSFDAIRATLNYDPLVIDLVAAEVIRTVLNVDSSENLYGINANYAVNKKNNVEGYWFERRRGRKNTSPSTMNNKVDTTHNLGARIVSRQIENLTYQLEVAFQLGTRLNAAGVAIPTQRRRAWALETAATYDLKNVKRIAKYSPTLTMLYSYFSGNRGSGEKNNSAWDPMYENQTSGNIANLLFPQSNAHVLGGILSAKPVEDVILKGEYYAYWWDKRFSNGQPLLPGSALTGEALSMTNNKFAGQEIDLTATYAYTEDVQFSLMGGIMLPGSSFAKYATGTAVGSSRNPAEEVIGSMKVTF